MLQMEEDEVVQVIMQDDGQIVMPEGQFIHLDADNSEMQYIQVVVQRLLSPVRKVVFTCLEEPKNVSSSFVMKVVKERSWSV